MLLTDQILKSPVSQPEFSAICRAFGLPTEDSFSAEEIKATLFRDKKRNGQTLRFIFLSRIGGGIARDLSVSRVSALVEELCHGH